MFYLKKALYEMLNAMMTRKELKQILARLWLRVDLKAHWTISDTISKNL